MLVFTFYPTTFPRSIKFIQQSKGNSKLKCLPLDFDFHLERIEILRFGNENKHA